ncbi:MAG: type IV pilus modification protein PilV [Gammaproteobacteria bacterium]|nr:type IV pilus modification protein PilV [Gammaproteobacteria bacterium]
MSIKLLTIKNMQNSHINKSKGFTLLEALIGFLILSIGMLGIASLQAVSLKAGKTSVYGSVAMMKVEELFESMRANPTVLSTYASAGVNNACTGTKNCTETELAQDDVYWWEKNLKAGLPGAATTVVTVTPAVAPSKMATVKIDITWSERNKDTSTGADTSVSKTYTSTANICTEIPC